MPILARLVVGVALAPAAAASALPASPGVSSLAPVRVLDPSLSLLHHQRVVQSQLLHPHLVAQAVPRCPGDLQAPMPLSSVRVALQKQRQTMTGTAP